MKRKYNSIIFLLIASMMVSCFSDKGNYDYTDINEVVIDFEDGYEELLFGEEYEFSPTISSQVSENPDNYTINWYIGEDEVEEWRDMPSIKWDVDRVVKFVYLSVVITDKSNEMEYRGRIRIDVVGPYESYYSWMILSDNNGKSQLSYFSSVETDTKTRPGHVLFKTTNFFTDVYSGANGGAELGSGPLAIREHFREPIDWSEDIIGNVFIFQESGAVDLNGQNFEKEIDLTQAFDGGTPSGVTLMPGSTMDFVDFLSDTEGKLYMRVKRSSSVYNSEYYLQTPHEDDGEILEDCIVCRGYYKENRNGYTVIYDGKNKRLIHTPNSQEGYDENWRPEDFVREAGRINEFPASHAGADLTKIVPLNDFTGYDVLGVEMCADPKNTSTYGIFIVLKEQASGKILLQKVTLEGDGGNPAVMDIVLNELVGVPSTITTYALPIYSPQEYAFFADGNNLYMVDLNNITNGATIYYTFDAPITVINNKSNYNRHLAVGLEDGSFFILDVTGAKNNDLEDRVIYEADEKVGKIVDIQYKQIDHWNY